MNKQEIKTNIQEWLLRVNEKEQLPTEITALNFGLFEPYGIELVGAEIYDKDDDDWACEEDYVSVERSIMLPISKDIGWETVLNCIAEILKELITELKDVKLLNVKHITTGFCDGELLIIK